MERECVGEEKGRENGMLAVFLLGRLQKRREGEVLELEMKRERECVCVCVCCQMRIFSSFPLIYTSLLLMISCQVPPNTVSLHLYLTPISKVLIPLPFMQYLYQQVWWGYVRKSTCMCVYLNPYTYILYVWYNVQYKYLT